MSFIKKFLALTLCLCAQTAQASPGPHLLAHRGLLRFAPENTLPAFEASLVLGFGLELDVRQTKDGHLVVIHDAELERTTSGKGLVAETTLKEIRGLDAGRWFHPSFAGARVPTLEDVLVLVGMHGSKNAIVALNMKSFEPGIEARIESVIKRHGLLRQVFVFAQSRASSVRFREARIASVANNKWVFSRLIEDPLPRDLWVRFIPNATQVAQAHAAGKRVWLGAGIIHRDTDIWDKTLEAGVDGICTDWPAEARNYFSRRGET